MPTSPLHPTLRLVHSGEVSPPRVMPGRDGADRRNDRGWGGESGGSGGAAARAPSLRERAEERIARENASAASLSALDPRWILAVQATRELQGGRAAILTPEGRRRLLLVGSRLGMRSFDTNLVIAIVQDGARCGEDPLASMGVGRLRLVGGEAELADVKPGLSWAMVAAITILAGVFGSVATLLVVRMWG
jgi:hypothetical protein